MNKITCINLDQPAAPGDRDNRPEAISIRAALEALTFIDDGVTTEVPGGSGTLHGFRSGPSQPAPAPRSG